MLHLKKSKSVSFGPDKKQYCMMSVSNLKLGDIVMIQDNQTFKFVPCKIESVEYTSIPNIHPDKYISQYDITFQKENDPSIVFNKLYNSNDLVIVPSVHNFTTIYDKDGNRRNS